MLQSCRAAALSAVLCAICLCGPGLSAQSNTSPMGGAASQAADTESSASTRDSLTSDTPANVSLSAAQIISIIQNRPEIVVELKELIAETQTSGPPVQADSITDEALYSQIVASKELRQSITLFLRSRGYVSDSDLQQMTVIQEHTGLDDPSLLANQAQTGIAQGITSSDEAATRTSLLSQLPEQLPTTAASATAQPENDGSTRDKTAHTKSRNITDEPPVLRQPAPYNLTSLRDLYTQIPDSTETLKRFGSEVFTRRDRATAGAIPLDVPIGPDYVLGPGRQPHDRYLGRSDADGFTHGCARWARGAA